MGFPEPGRGLRSIAHAFGDIGDLSDLGDPPDTALSSAPNLPLYSAWRTAVLDVGGGVVSYPADDGTVSLGFLNSAGRRGLPAAQFPIEAIPALVSQISYQGTTQPDLISNSGNFAYYLAPTPVLLEYTGLASSLFPPTWTPPATTHNPNPQQITGAGSLLQSGNSPVTTQQGDPPTLPTWYGNFLTAAKIAGGLLGLVIVADVVQTLRPRSNPPRRRRRRSARRRR